MCGNNSGEETICECDKLNSIVTILRTLQGREYYDDYNDVKSKVFCSEKLDYSGAGVCVYSGSLDDVSNAENILKLGCHSKELRQIFCCRESTLVDELLRSVKKETYSEECFFLGQMESSGEVYLFPINMKEFFNALEFCRLIREQKSRVLKDLEPLEIL